MERTFEATSVAHSPVSLPIVSSAELSELMPLITPYGFTLWWRYAHLCGQKGFCYPSLKTLAAETAMGETNVKKYRAIIERLGIIQVEVRPVAGNRHESSKVFLLKGLPIVGAED
jgi:Helix-turn-helix domain